MLEYFLHSTFSAVILKNSTIIQTLIAMKHSVTLYKNGATPSYSRRPILWAQLLPNFVLLKFQKYHKIMQQYHVPYMRQSHARFILRLIRLYIIEAVYLKNLIFFTDTSLWFNLVVLYWRSNELLCIFHTLILSKSPSFTGMFSPTYSHFLTILMCSSNLRWCVDQLFGRPQWLTVRWRSQNYVNRVINTNLI